MKTNNPTIVVSTRNVQNAATVRDIVSRLSRQYFGVAPRFTGNGRSLSATITPESKYRLKTVNVLDMGSDLADYLGDDATISVTNATFTVADADAGEFHIAW
jgi:hypothetical protein